MNKPKDGNVNSISETSTVCPLCKSDDEIITDPKSGEIICNKCGMVILDRSLEEKHNSVKLYFATDNLLYPI